MQETKDWLTANNANGTDGQSELGPTALEKAGARNFEGLDEDFGYSECCMRMVSRLLSGGRKAEMLQDACDSSIRSGILFCYDKLQSHR